MVKLSLIATTTAPPFGGKVSADPMFLPIVRDLWAIELCKVDLFILISYQFEQTGSLIVVGTYRGRLLTRVGGSLLLLVWLYLLVLVGKNLLLQQRRW